MQPVAWPEPDPQVAAAIAAMYGARKTERPLAVLIRDRLGEWLGDEDFAAAFGTRGKPGWSPSRLALVTVLQRAENLTDRLAADAVRTRIDWKYLLGLPLDDPGFDHTVLAEFRARVADAGLEQVALDALLECLAAGGLVKAGGKQRTDSTHVIAAVAALNRLELAGESVRAALEALAAAHPAWVEQRVCVADFARRYGTPMTSWRPPVSQARRDELAIAYARDGYALLKAVYDKTAPTVTCPQGKTAAAWTPCTQHGKDAIVATFSASDCGPCPARTLCTAGKRRQPSLLPRDLAEAQAAARSAETTIPFQAEYARRAGVEGTMHQAASHGARRARYRGLPKTRLDHAYMACALNLLRLGAFWTGTPLDRQRTSHLARLELGLAA